MKLDQLKYLVEIADCGSISLAAEKLHVSQPNISQSIALLEGELQLKIFKRSRLGAQPTEIGKIFIEKARDILVQVRELEKMGGLQNNLVSGKLSIATISSMYMTLLTKTLNVFKNKYPNFQIDIFDGGSSQVNDYVATGKVDIGLAACRDISDFNSNISFEPLFIGKMMACVNRHSPFSKLSEISFSEIIKQPIVIYNEQHSMNPFILKQLKKYGDPNIVFTTGNSEAVKRAVIEGMGIGFYTDFALKTDPYVYNGDIIPIKITEQDEDITTFGILYKKNAFLSSSCKDFIAEVKQQSNKLKLIYNLPSVL